MSALVTNAAVYVHTSIGATVAVAEATLAVAVADADPRMPHPRIELGQSPPLVNKSAWLDDGGRSGSSCSPR